MYLLDLDAGIFYNSLAVSAFCLSARHTEADQKALMAEGLHYYIKGLNSTNAQLVGNMGSNLQGIIVSIMGVAVHTLGSGWCWETTALSPSRTGSSDDEWPKHFGAIKAILARHGGVKAIESNTALRFWLYA